MIGAALVLPGGTPMLAQDGTPPDDPELVTETSGMLPAADLPTMNEQGHVFEFSSTFSGSLSEVPQEAMVYSMIAPTYTSDDVQAAADRIGLDGEVEDMGGDTYTVEGDAGSLFVTPGRMQFISSEELPEGDLPSDERAIASAREWLRTNGMLPANVGEGTILSRIDNPARVIVGFQPVTPSPLISSTPNVTATIGPDGSLIEATHNWAEISAWQTFQLRGADAAWEDVESRRAWVDASLPTDQFAPGSTVGGSVEYTRVSLAYTTSGIPGEQQYLQPVYVFEGTLTPDGVEQTFPARAYVPALININQPVG